MEAGRSRRDFISRAFFGTAIAGMLSRARSACAKTESDQVDRRRLGRTGADVSILGLGLGGAFMDAYERNLEAGHALLLELLPHTEPLHKVTIIPRGRALGLTQRLLSNDQSSSGAGSKSASVGQTS